MTDQPTPRAPEPGPCICDRAEHPTIVHPDCPRHGNFAPEPSSPDDLQQQITKALIFHAPTAENAERVMDVLRREGVVKS